MTLSSSAPPPVSTPHVPVASNAALLHLASGLVQRMGFKSTQPSELASLQTAAGHVLWRTSTDASQIAFEVIVLVDRVRLPYGLNWPIENFLAVGAQCNSLVPMAAGSLASRYRRITIVEVGYGPLDAEDQARLGALKSGTSGTTLVEAMHVDATSGQVWSNGGFATDVASTVVLKSESPVDWVRWLLTAPIVSGFASERAVGPLGPPLFSANAIGLASFLASPLAGGLLLAWNLHKTKRGSAALLTALASVAILSAFLALAIFTNLPGAIYTGISVGAAMGLRAAAVKLCPDTKNAASPWLAVLVSVGCVVAILALAFGIALVAPESKVDLGNHVTAYYEDGASKQDATRLGHYLVDTGFLLKDADVRIARRRPSEVNISFVVGEGAWDKPEVVGAYQKLASSLATDLFPGKTVKVTLMTPYLVEKRTITVK